MHCAVALDADTAFEAIADTGAPMDMRVGDAAFRESDEVAAHQPVEAVIELHIDRERRLSSQRGAARKMPRSAMICGKSQSATGARPWHRAGAKQLRADEGKRTRLMSRASLIFGRSGLRNDEQSQVAGKNTGSPLGGN